VLLSHRLKFIKLFIPRLDTQHNDTNNNEISITTSSVNRTNFSTYTSVFLIVLVIVIMLSAVRLTIFMLSVVTLTIIMLSMCLSLTNAHYLYAECYNVHYPLAECPHAECCSSQSLHIECPYDKGNYTECCLLIIFMLRVILISVVLIFFMQCNYAKRCAYYLYAVSL
jgi:hypothetical protein